MTAVQSDSGTRQGNDWTWAWKNPWELKTQWNKHPVWVPALSVQDHIWIVSDDLVWTLMGNIFLQNTSCPNVIFLQNTWLQTFTAHEMHNCCQQGVVMLVKITFAQIAFVFKKTKFYISPSIEPSECVTVLLEICFCKCSCATFSATSPLNVRARPRPGTLAQARNVTHTGVPRC